MRVAGPRVAAALAVGFLLVAQLGTAIHLLLVSHESCAVHGGLVHVEDGAEIRASTPAQTMAFAMPETGSAEVHAHGHCLFVASQCDRPCIARVNDTRSPAPVVSSPVLADAPRMLGASCPVYLLAPKNSPPA